MIKHFYLVLALSFLAANETFADNYLVYSVIGDAKWYNGKNYVPLKQRDNINQQTILSIGKESSVVVINGKKGRMYSLTTSGNNRVSTLLNKSNGGKSLSKQYMSYLVKQLFDKESLTLSHPSTYMQSSATSFRSTKKDSLLLNRLALLAGTVKDMGVEKSLTNVNTVIKGEYDISFDLVDCLSGSSIGHEVDINTNCYVRVKNNSGKPLYVNILNIDEKGNKYLVLPVDAAALCAHLLVPANSTVSFRSEPFEFVEPKSKETFLLVATDEPVDFSILMSPIQGNGDHFIQSGLYRHHYETR
ncbi:MAG: hypothetical protein J6Y23_08370 [Prevotella sp.]|nr:hypothetical protein [Prevotella sp.]